jgi:E3 SUMO-protein ligase PIAS1
VRRYFNSILESTPDTVEDVIVEADGEWHTSDDTYASDAWKKTHKPAPPLVSPAPRLKQEAPSSPSSHIREASTQESQRQGDVVVLDSEEEDEGEVKRELSLSRPEMRGLFGTQVIDLTVESDDESASIRSLGKRKAESDSASASGDVWKKSRIGELTNGTTVNDNVDISTSGGLVSGINNGTRRYANGAPLQHRPHSTQFTPVPPAGPPFTAPYYSQPSRTGAPFPGSFGPQVSHRAGYYSQFGNIA